MSEKILVTGATGYIGTAFIRALEKRGLDFLAVDADYRQEWVKRVGGYSLTDYKPVKNFREVDLTNSDYVDKLLEHYQPTAIVHLASQPSGPFSEISRTHRLHTQTNNLQMMLNLLGGCKELGLSPKFIVTTTTGVPGAPNEPIVEGPMANLAGSAYHVSRGFDSANLTLAAKQWGFRILEMRTAITYGTRIDDFNEPITRLDWDYYFGTVLHRFCLLKKMEKPIQIYGQGLQKKPFISLNDVVRSLINAVDWDIKQGHEIVNQTTLCLPIVGVALRVGGILEHIKNPRVEKETHNMVIENEKFLKILGKKEESVMEHDIKEILKDMDTSKLCKDWEKIYAGK